MGNRPLRRRSTAGIARLPIKWASGERSVRSRRACRRCGLIATAASTTAESPLSLTLRARLALASNPYLLLLVWFLHHIDVYLLPKQSVYHAAALYLSHPVHGANVVVISCYASLCSLWKGCCFRKRGGVELQVSFVCHMSL